MIDYADIAAWAEENSMGDYNEVISLMESDHFIPGYEKRSKEIYKGYGSDYGYSEKLSKIFDAFVKEHGDCEVMM